MKKTIIIERGQKEATLLPYKHRLSDLVFDEGILYEFTATDFSGQTVELCDFIHHRFPENRGIHINLPLDKAYLREFELPFTDKKKIKELLPHELESYLPFEKEELVYDYRTFSDYKSQVSKIVTVAAEKKVLTDYIRSFKDQNIKLNGIYVPMDGLSYALSEASLDNAILLYLSSQATRILIYKNGEWLKSRVIPLGHDTLVKKLVRKWKKNYDESKQVLLGIPGVDLTDMDVDLYKKQYQMTSGQVTVLGNVIDEFRNEIIREIHRTVDNSDFENSEKPTLYLATDLSNPLFYQNLIAEKLDMNVASFPYEKTPVHLVGRDYFIPVSSAKAIQKGKALNLLNRELSRMFTSTEKQRSWKYYIAYGTAVLLLITSFMFDFLDQKRLVDIAREKQKKVFMKYFGQAPNSEVSYISQAETIVLQAKKKSEIYIKFLNKPKVLNLINAVNTAFMIDPSLEVDKLLYGKDQLKIYATTSSFDQLNKIKSEVKKSKIFKEINSVKESSVPGPGGVKRTKFTLVLKPDGNTTNVKAPR